MSNRFRGRWTRKFILFFALGAMLVALVIPLLGLISGGAQSQAPGSLEQQQQHVSEVILGTDRIELIGSSPTRGNPEAEIVLIKFSDFECPFCQVASGNMKTFMDKHEEDVLYVYKHLPLTQIHPQAMPAAAASWAAQQQGQFWPYHDALFAMQDTLNPGVYETIAQDLGLDVEQFNRDRNSPAAREALEQDVELAQRLQLRGTPTFVMNNLLLPAGTPMELFEAIVLRQQQS